MYNLSENVKMNIEGYCMYRKIVKEMNKWKNDFKMPLMLVGIKQMRINIYLHILSTIFIFFCLQTIKYKSNLFIFFFLTVLIKNYIINL